MSWQTDFCRAYFKKRGSGRVEEKTVLLPRETASSAATITDFSGSTCDMIFVGMFTKTPYRVGVEAPIFRFNRADRLCRMIGAFCLYHGSEAPVNGSLLEQKQRR